MSSASTPRTMFRPRTSSGLLRRAQTPGTGRPATRAPATSNFRRSPTPNNLNRSPTPSRLTNRSPTPTPRINQGFIDFRGVRSVEDALARVRTPQQKERFSLFLLHLEFVRDSMLARDPRSARYLTTLISGLKG